MICPHSDCAADIPDHLDRCSVCWRDIGAPNVRAADLPTERAALDARYRAAQADAIARGCEAVARAFEEQASKSTAVMCKTVQQFQGLVPNELIATYHEQVRASVRFPDKPEWATLRDAAEGHAFSGYRERIHYGALSLNGKGARGWGEIEIAFRDVAIRSRVSVFEENVVLFVWKNGLFPTPVAGAMPAAPSGLIRIPAGHRASWDERAKLCIAKLAKALQPATTVDDFPGILLRNEDKNARTDSDFVEVHIFGTLTTDSFAHVRIPKKYENDVSMADTVERLRNHRVTVEFADDIRS